MPDRGRDDLGCCGKKGFLGPGKELVEPTLGNTDVALAFVAAARGISIAQTMPETISVERRKLLFVYGAKLVLTEGAKAMKGAIAKACEIAASDLKYLLLQRFQTPPSTNAPQARKSGRIPAAWSISWSRASAPGARSPESRAI